MNLLQRIGFVLGLWPRKKEEKRKFFNLAVFKVWDGVRRIVIEEKCDKAPPLQDQTDNKPFNALLKAVESVSKSPVITCPECEGISTGFKTCPFCGVKV